MIKKGRDPDSKRKQNYQGSLPPATEKALVQSILDNRRTGIKFQTICDSSPDIFGLPGSKLRLRVQRRRNYLLTHPEGLVLAIAPLSPEKHGRDEEDLAPASPPAAPARQASPHASIKPSKFPALLTPSPSVARTRSTVMSPRDDNDDPISFLLYIEQPWKNPFGMIVIKGTEVEEANTVVDKLTIMKPIFDYTDFDKKLFKARLCNDGGGIIISEPTIPGYLWQNPTEIQLLVDDTEDVGNVCQPSFRTYKTIRTDMKKDRNTRTKDIVYRFPSGVTCLQQ